MKMEGGHKRRSFNGGGGFFYSKKNSSFGGAEKGSVHQAGEWGKGVKGEKKKMHR